MELSESLKKAMKDVEKVYGPSAIVFDESPTNDSDVVVPTGIAAVDAATGRGGIPEGIVVEMYGPYSCGKSTLALKIVANAQRLGKRCAYIDAEYGLDRHYAESLGVVWAELGKNYPACGEQALDVLRVLVESGEYGLVVVDSVAALVPQAQLEGAMEDAQMGAQARLMSKALGSLAAKIARNKATVIFINQIRMKIGVMFGNPEVTPGGNALKFYSAMRIDVRRTPIKRGDDVTGQNIRVKFVKNKCARPFLCGEFDLYFDTGIAHEESLLKTAVAYGLVEKKGTHFSMGETSLGQGKKCLVGRKDSPEYVTLHEALYAKLYARSLPISLVDVDEEVPE